MTRKQSTTIISLQLSITMRARGLTVKQLAERVGSSAHFVRQHLAGERTPTVHKLVEYAVAMGVKPTDLVSCLAGAV